MSYDSTASLSQRESKELKKNKTTTLHPKIYADKGIGVDLQVFMIKNDQDNELVSKNGNTIFIKAHTFDSYQSKVVLKEVLDKSAAVREGLNTVQDNGIVLESGGMIYLNALDKDENEQEPNNSIEFSMETSPQMQIYNTPQADQAWQRSNDNSNESTDTGYNRIYHIRKKEYQDRANKRRMKLEIERERLLLESKEEGADQSIYKRLLDDNQIAIEQIRSILDVHLGILRRTFRGARTRSLFSSNKLKWINCDIPLKEQERQQISVKNVDNMAQVFVVLKDSFSICPVSYRSHQQRFHAIIPQNTAIALVGIYEDEQEQYHLAMTNITANELKNQSEYELVFEAVSVEKLKEKLAVLG